MPEREKYSVSTTMHLHYVCFQCCDNIRTVMSYRRFETNCEYQVRINTVQHNLICHVPRSAYLHRNVILVPKVSFQRCFRRNCRNEQCVEPCGTRVRSVTLWLYCGLSHTAETACRLQSWIHGVSVRPTGYTACLYGRQATRCVCTDRQATRRVCTVVKLHGVSVRPSGYTACLYGRQATRRVCTAVRLHGVSVRPPGTSGCVSA